MASAPPPHHKVGARNARRPAAERSEHDASKAINHFIHVGLAHQVAALFCQLELQHFCFVSGVLGIGCRSRRVAMLRTQMRQITQPRLVLIEKTLRAALDHTLRCR